MNEDIADMIQSLLEDDSDHALELVSRYRNGCNVDDTRDSRGAPLRPRVNEAGEPWWM